MYVEETISKYEKYINPAQAKLFRFMGLASVERYAEGWTITCLLYTSPSPRD